MLDGFSLYPDTVFHFTSRQALVDILKDDFRPSFARESLSGPTRSKSFGVPMVSFCDLRLSETPSHIEHYGPYGLGLSKQWAHNSGLNPVHYMSSGCPSTDRLLEAIHDIFDLVDQQQDVNGATQVISAYVKVLDILRYVKNYEGPLHTGKVHSDRFRFADEREWRYVPPWDASSKPIVSAGEIADGAGKALANSSIEHLRLRFQPSDIKYIVVQSENERDQAIQDVADAKQRFGHEEVQRLTSRIITAAQIHNDF